MYVQRWRVDFTPGKPESGRPFRPQQENMRSALEVGRRLLSLVVPTTHAQHPQPCLEDIIAKCGVNGLC